MYTVFISCFLQAMTNNRVRVRSRKMVIFSLLLLSPPRQWELWLVVVGFIVAWVLEMHIS
jgi:hypothetical protein